MKINYIVAFIVGWFLSLSTYAKVDTLLVFSESMHKSIPNLVITPDNYTKMSSEMPVLYLLHGAGGKHTDWLSNVPLVEKYANDYNMIVVCPDGGSTSWYFDSPIDEKMRYETYVSYELVEKVDAKYNTITTKKGRAITGLSMGGHGALYLAIKHQDIWGAVGSMSGGVDIRPFPNNWDIKKRLGKYSKNKQNWEENTVVNLIPLIKKDLKIIIDCGTEDFFLEVNQQFHNKLLSANITHNYKEYSGSHNWTYWNKVIKYQIKFFKNYFNYYKMN